MLALSARRPPAAGGEGQRGAGRNVRITEKRRKPAAPRDRRKAAGRLQAVAAELPEAVEAARPAGYELYK